MFCGEHHRIVDANPRIYSVEVLAKYLAAAATGAANPAPGGLGAIEAALVSMLIR